MNDAEAKAVLKALSPYLDLAIRPEVYLERIGKALASTVEAVAGGEASLVGQDDIEALRGLSALGFLTSACADRIISACGYVSSQRAPAAGMDRALREVRAALTNENGLNAHSIVDTVWVSQIETAVDCIDAAFHGGDAEGRTG